MKKRNVLTEEQKKYIIEHYPTEQTWRIADVLGITNKQVSGYAWSKGVKKADDFIVIRSDNSLTVEQQDFIFDNYGKMSNVEIVRALGIDGDLLTAFARKHNLKRNDKLLDSRSSIPLWKRQYILDNYATALTTDIVKVVHLPADTIRSYAYSHGVRRDVAVVPIMCETEHGLSNEQKKYIIQHYSDVKTEDIANYLGLTKEQVRNYAGNKKLTKNCDAMYKVDNYFSDCVSNRKNKAYSLQKHLGHDVEPKLGINDLFISKYGKYHVNQDYFQDIDNEWKAYWLGFLYADGYVISETQRKKEKHSLGVGLQIRDRGHIQKLLDSLQSNVPIKDYRTNYKDCFSSKVVICNKKICSDLISHGCVPRKSFILKFPILRDDLVRHFIRGYFDGDGCISINKDKHNVRVNFVGTEDMLKHIVEIFVKECGAHKPKLIENFNNNGNIVYSVQWGNVYTCHKIYNYLYKGANIYLDRKLEKFDTIYCLE